MLSTDQQSSDRPGPIDNSDIISNGSNCDGNDLDIHRTLVENTHYVLVPQEVWERLLEW
jgi:ubiquitin carboxyl-terminal hydrolase 4/11/15